MIMYSKNAEDKSLKTNKNPKDVKKSDFLEKRSCGFVGVSLNPLSPAALRRTTVRQKGRRRELLAWLV